MSRIKTPAVVLRRWPYSESSLVLRVLTPDHGVVSLFAKGCERPTSGSMGVLDTWCLVEIEYRAAEDAELLNLYRSRLLHRFPKLATSPDRLAVAGIAAEIAEYAAPPGPSSGPAFLYLVHALEALEGGIPPQPFLARTLVEGLALLGLSPMIPLPLADGPVWFSASYGGCVPREAMGQTQDRRRVSAESLRLIAALAQDPAAADDADSDQVAEALTILEEFLQYHLERRPRALELLRRRKPSLKTLQ